MKDTLQLINEDSSLIVKSKYGINNAAVFCASGVAAAFTQQDIILVPKTI
jgi:hypothetical protein